MTDGKPPHILIVDDEPIDRMVISELLKANGCLVSTVNDGVQAIRFLSTCPCDIDIIILDRMMPNLSGIDVLYKLCTMPIVRNIPVIMLTAHAERTDQKNAFTCGVFDLIFKPIDEVILMSTVNRALLEKKHKVF